VPVLMGKTATARCFLVACTAGLAIGLSGCSTRVLLTPDLGRNATSACSIQARVIYDGNPDYLPHALTAVPATGQATALRYTYDTTYNSAQGITLLQVVNPLMIVGFPTGSNSGTVTGVLEVVRGGHVIRSYAAACAMSRMGTVFSEGETLTQMRRKGLLLVRDNISAQVCRDQQTLQTLLGAAQP
jgi:hypothetical protein